MVEYIEREETRKLMCNICEGRDICNPEKCAAQAAINEAPAADVAPVIHAHWTDKDRFLGIIFGDCSNCGVRSIADAYCSNCGAKMEVTDNV